MTATPCQTGDPEDWFIEGNGLQYSDEPFERIMLGETEADGWISPEEQKRLALIRRRKAKQACLECPVRLECLTVALDDEPLYGIWGGYYPDELRAIRAERDRRRGAVD